MFALAGAHRSGKTTLARAVAADLRIDFLETKVSDVFTDLGIDPKAPLPFAERLRVQNAILRSLEVQYALRNAPFIADRSPFDVLGYTFADIQRDTLDDDLRSQLAAHVTLAETITSEYLAGVLIVRPLPNQVDAPGKAQACPWYMHHVYCMVREAVELSSPYLATRGFVSAELMVHDHDARVADTKRFIAMVLGYHSDTEPKEEPKIWMPGS